MKDYTKKYENDRFFQEVFVYGMYDPVMKLDNIDTVIDLGACAGEFSFWVNHRAKDIYAIEPVKEQYEELENNIKDFGFKKVKPFRIALSNSNRSGHMGNLSGRGGQILSEDITPTSDEIPVKTLATFMKENNIDRVHVLKVDIEEGEKNVFESEDFKDVAHKIDFIIGEHVGHVSDTVLKSFGFKSNEFKGGFFYQR